MADKPPPPREEPVFGDPVNVNPVPVHMTGGAIWKRPDSPARMERVFRSVRDHDLSYLRVLLETQLGTALSIDGSGDGQVELDWDRCVTPNLTWSESLGLVGPGLLVNLRKKPIAMVQIGAVEVDMETYQMIPDTWFVEKFVPPDSKTGFVLTQRNYFLTHEGLKEFGDPDFIRTITADERLWYQVTFSCLEFAFQRLIQRNMR